MAGEKDPKPEPAPPRRQVKETAADRELSRAKRIIERWVVE